MKDDEIEEIEELEELFEDLELDEDSFIEEPVKQTNSSSTSDRLKAQLEKNKNKQINDTKVNTEQNKIDNNSNGFKNPKNFINNDKQTASRLASVRSGRFNLPFNRNNIDEEAEEHSEQKEEKKSLAHKNTSNAIKLQSGGAINDKTASVQADFAEGLAKDYIENFIKSHWLIIIIVVLVVLTVFLALMTILTTSEDDDSETRKETDSYILGTGTEDDLISYLILMNYCDDFETCKDTNAFKFYEDFKNQYDKYQGSCPSDMGESYLKNGGTPCEVTVNVPVIFETLSYDLTDDELFGSLSFGGKKSDNIDLKDVLKTNSNDIKKLSLAMSEYVHEKCYELKTVEQCSSTSSGGTGSNTTSGSGTPSKPSGANGQSSPNSGNTTNQSLPSAGAGTVLNNQNNSSSSSNNGQVCKTVQVKEKKDKYYFQISFDKYVSYLKYGDTSSHPNLSKKEPVLVGDYETRICTGPQDDTVTFGPTEDENISSTPSGGTSSNEKLNALFPDGLPTSREQMEKYLTTVTIAKYELSGNLTTTTVTVHKDLASDVQSIFQEIANAKFPINDVACYSWREKNGGASGLSHHSYGVACDINPVENCMQKNDGTIVAGSYWKPGEDPYSITSNGPVVQAFSKKGWTWGGNWKSSKDYMHFSYTGQ